MSGNSDLEERSQRPPPNQVGGALAAVTRRALLQFATPGSLLQDGLDCAELLALCGNTDSASCLLHVLNLESGRQAKPAVARDIERDARREPFRVNGKPAQSSIEIAVAQLRLIRTMAGDLVKLPENGRDITGADRRTGDSRTGIQRIPSPKQLTSRCVQLTAALSGPFHSQAPDDLRSVLVDFWNDVLEGTNFDANRHVGVELPTLGSLIAAQRLRRFLVKVSDLADAPFGSFALAHAAADLHEDSLGPWFTNIGNVIRAPSDVFALVQLAFGTPPREELDRDELERWLYLLSVNMPDAALRDMLEELADQGLMRVIWGILERTARRTETDISVLWCIRDAGLDIGDYELAVRAQRLVIERNALKANEWILLGRLEATAGDRRTAEDTFVHGLELDPGDTGGRDNLNALRRGSIDEIQVSTGFGSSPHRKLLRAKRRREARPDLV